MSLMHTLLPEPVEPAIRRCGIRSRSPIIGAPAISLPMANAIGDLDFWKGSLSIISRNKTVAVFLFGISMPTADLPGMGASICTAFAASASAMLSARLVILFILMPGPGCNSNRVMTGPTDMLTIFVSIPKLASVSTRSFPCSATDSPERIYPGSVAFNRDNGGLLYCGTALASGSDVTFVSWVTALC